MTGSDLTLLASLTSIYGPRFNFNITFFFERQFSIGLWNFMQRKKDISDLMLVSYGLVRSRSVLLHVISISIKQPAATAVYDKLSISLDVLMIQMGL